MVQILLRQGANPKAQQPKGESALHYAMAGFFKRLHQGRNCLMGIPMSRQPLEYDFARVVFGLLDAGVDGNCKTKKGGYTAMHQMALLGEHPGHAQVRSLWWLVPLLIG